MGVAVAGFNANKLPSVAGDVLGNTAMVASGYVNYISVFKKVAGVGGDLILLPPVGDVVEGQHVWLFRDDTQAGVLQVYDDLNAYSVLQIDANDKRRLYRVTLLSGVWVVTLRLGTNA